jgi:hypothetical protein
MQAGVVHDWPEVSIDGGLALFCPTCPQMNTNILPKSEWNPMDRLGRTFCHAFID